MQRIGWACIQLGQAQVEVACGIVLAVDKQGSYSDHFGWAADPQSKLATT